MRKQLVSIGWLSLSLLLVITPSVTGFLYLESISPKPTIFHASEQVFKVVASPDGRTLASTDFDGTITIWDMEAQKRTATLLRHANYWTPFAYSPDGSKIVGAGDDAAIKLWNVATGEVQRTLRGHEKGRFGVESVAFSQDGKSIISAGKDMTIRLWDVNTGENTATFAGQGEFSWLLATSPDGSTLASNDNKTLKLWDLVNRKERATLSESSWTQITFSPDGKTLASAGRKGNEVLSLWDVKSGEQRSFGAPLEMHFDCSGRTNSLQFSPDGKRLVLCSRKPTFFDDDDSVCMARIEIWDVATGKKTIALGGSANPIFPPSTHLRYWLRDGDQPDVHSFLFAADGKLVTLESLGSQIMMREIDFGLAPHYRWTSLLVTVSTLAVAGCLAVWFWFNTAFCWYCRRISLVATLAALMFLGRYLLSFWIEAWGEDTMPEISSYDAGACWLGFLAVILAVVIGREAVGDFLSARRRVNAPGGSLLIHTIAAILLLSGIFTLTASR